MRKPISPQPLLTAPVALTTRRAFLQSILTTWATTCCFPWLGTWASEGSQTNDSPAWLEAITGQREATSRIGQAYLETHRAEQDPDHLLSLIDEALVNLPGIDTHQLKDPAQIAEALKRVVRTDYINNEVVNLLGWVLSVTEARLYALVAVLHRA